MDLKRSCILTLQNPDSCTEFVLKKCRRVYPFVPVGGLIKNFMKCHRNICAHISIYTHEYEVVTY